MKIAADVAAKGGHFVDTPLTRTPKEAEDGKLGVMTGGDKAVLEEIRPVLECFADTIVHAGAAGRRPHAEAHQQLHRHSAPRRSSPKAICSPPKARCRHEGACAIS